MLSIDRKKAKFNWELTSPFENKIAESKNLSLKIRQKA